MISKVRGTQDLIDLDLHNFVLDKIKKQLKCYNFNEIQTPVLEHTKLFIHSLGQETDIVSKEMYVFPAEKEEDSICLRPEATAATIRAYLENHIETKPWKVFTYGPMFRRERPQKGRWRQFSQINIEVINSDSINQDVLFIKMLDSFFNNSLKLENYVIKLNFLGCLEDRKNHRKKLETFLESEKDKLCPTCIKRKESNILRVFDCKNEQCKKVYLNAPKLTDMLCDQCNSEWESLRENLHILGVSHIHDPYLVRGLDYYNKTVFEFCSQELGSQDAFCGGGRYSLGKDIGYKENIPSIGVGIGMGRLLILAEKNRNKLAIPQKPELNLVIPLTKNQAVISLLLANQLQSNGICCDILLELKSAKAMLRKANKLGAKHVLVLGEDEQKNGTVSLKNMITGENKIVKQTEVQNFIK